MPAKWGGKISRISPALETSYDSRLWTTEAPSKLSLSLCLIFLNLIGKNRKKFVTIFQFKVVPNGYFADTVKITAFNTTTALNTTASISANFMMDHSFSPLGTSSDVLLLLGEVEHIF